MFLFRYPKYYFLRMWKSSEEIKSELMLKMSAIRELKPKEQKVLSMRFGLEDGITHRLQEVGQELGVTRERVRQIEAKALELVGINYEN